MRKTIMLFCLFVCANQIRGQRHWTVADGLPTGEVQQIVELPNGQMLVNCEGVFCIYNGRTFDVVPCDQNKAYQLPRYTNRYGVPRPCTVSSRRYRCAQPSATAHKGSKHSFLNCFFRLGFFGRNYRNLKYKSGSSICVCSVKIDIGTHKCGYLAADTQAQSCTLTLAPISVAISRQILRPSPVPCTKLFSLVKRSNIASA